MFIAKQLSLLSKHLIKTKSLYRFTSSYSYSFEPSLEPYSLVTIGQLIDSCAQDSGQRTACVSVHQNIIKTYSELNSDVNKLAQSLKSIGCAKGDRVGIWAPNCYEWLITQYATAKIGAILVNVNPGYRDKELDYCLNLVECHTLICSQKFRTTDYCEILSKIAPNILIDNSGTRVHCDKVPSLKNLIVIDSEEEIAPKNIVRFSDFLSNSTDQSPDQSIINADDEINIQFTSGTTGHPKAATLTHHNVIQNARFVAKRMLEGINETNPLSLCLPNPLYHCFGSVLGSLLIALRRGTLVLPAPVFNPVSTMEAIHDYKCNIIYGTPTMYVDLLSCHHGKYNTGSLIRGLMAGAPCPPPLVDEVEKQFPTVDILIPYGSTESSPVVTQTSITDSRKHRLESVGRPLDHIEIKVIDPNTGALRPRGETGEVCSRGHCNFVGYWSQREHTDQVLDRNRWYRSGDMGFMDEFGYLFINGRIKDMIIRGGENIYPKEIEDFLMSNPEVADVHVVGVPHKRLGEDLVAYIKLKNKSSLDARRVKEYCEGKISHFKIPANIKFVDDFPRTVTGKVQKFKLRQIAQEQFPKGY